MSVGGDVLSSRHQRRVRGRVGEVEEQRVGRHLPCPHDAARCGTAPCLAMMCRVCVHTCRWAHKRVRRRTRMPMHMSMHMSIHMSISRLVRTFIPRAHAEPSAQRPPLSVPRSCAVARGSASMSRSHPRGSSRRPSQPQTKRRTSVFFRAAITTVADHRLPRLLPDLLGVVLHRPQQRPHVRLKALRNNLIQTSIHSCTRLSTARCPPFQQVSASTVRGPSATSRSRVRHTRPRRAASAAA